MLTGYLEINEKYLLTVTEASEYFNVGPRQIQKVIEENEGNFALQLDGKEMCMTTWHQKGTILIAHQIVLSPMSN